MAKGFSRDSNRIVNAAVSRLNKFVKKTDIHGFASCVRSLQEEYGEDVADEAMRLSFVKNQNFLTKWVDAITAVIDEDTQSEIQASAIDSVAECLEESGLRLEDNLRITDDGVLITKAAVSSIEAQVGASMPELGEGVDSIEGFGIDRNPYVHPLSESVEIKGDDGMNLYAFVSVTISAANGWLEAGRKDRAIEALRDCVFCGCPSIDFDKLLYRSRYDDASLLKLVSIAVKGLEAKFDLAFELPQQQPRALRKA